MKRYRTISLLLSLLLCIAFTQNCFGPQSDDLIQTGIITIKNPLANLRQTFAQVQILYKIPQSGFQSALSFNYFTSYNTSSGLDMHVRGGRVGTTNFLGISLVLVQDRRWSTVEVSYFVSSRSDIWIGSFTQNLYFFNGQNNTNVELTNTTLSSCICNWVADNSTNSSYNVYLFISGLTTGIQRFNTSLTNVKFDKVKGNITVTLQKTSVKIQQITLTYIVFANPHSRFMENFYPWPGSRHPLPDYQFLGSTGFIQGTSTTVRNSFIDIISNYLNCIGECPSACITIDQCNQNLKNVNNNKTCFICPVNTQYNSNLNTCSPVCTSNQELVNGVCQCVFGFIRLGQTCVNRCGINQVWTGSICECALGYSRINGACRLCPAGSQTNQNKDSCICSKGNTFDAESMRCLPIICQAGTAYDSESDSCKSVCKLNELFNGSACTCKQNFYRINSVCNQCPTNTGFKLASGTCVACGVNQVSQNSLCVCKPNTFVINGACGICPSGTAYQETSQSCVSVCKINEQWNGSTCVCNSNFYRINSVCSQCPSGSGYRQSSATCIPCGLNEISQNSLCVCKVNTNLINGTCGVCPSGTSYQVATQSCASICKINEQWNGSVCVCNQHFYRINSVCSQCPTNTGYKQNTGACVSCEINEVSQNSICVCKANTFYINGACGVCPAGTIYNLESSSCLSICRDNEFYNGSACVCRQNFYKINSICGQCPANTGYRTASGTCVSCGINEVSLNSICACKPNTYVINGACGVCSSGTAYNSTSYQCQSICKDNQIFDGSNCVCQQNFYRINSVCSQCPSGSGYRQSSGVCVNCGVNEVSENSLCFCKPNTFKINGLCGVCPSGTLYQQNTQSCTSACSTNEQWNGSACICNQNFYRINSVCSQCPSGSGYRQSSANCVTCGINENSVNSLCICKPNTHVINGACGICQSGTVYDQDSQICVSICTGMNEVYNGSNCVCSSGYVRINNACGQCPSNSYYDESLKRCATQPTCPARSSWNSQTLSCICSVAGEYLINGTCQPCGANAGWNGTRCVCRSGFFLIANECMTCDINSSYSPTLKDCVCNRGFYGNRTSCQKCHSTCGKCSGPNSNQCLECVDVTYTLLNGECVKNSTCVKGMWHCEGVCKACPSYCTDCVDDTKCNECTRGFSLTEIALTPSTKYSYCEQICGDGRKFELECDDGNTIDGDGCSSKCQQEKGWTCSGGTTTSRSVCMKASPSRSFIIPKGAVLDIGKVLQGITVSYLTPILTQGGCPQCSQVLQVSVIRAQLIPSIKVDYVPTTQYKFLIEFNFHYGVFAIPPFSISIKINPKFANYFNEQDMAQDITLTIDSALLARKQEVVELTLDDLYNEKISISDTDLIKVFN